MLLEARSGSFSPIAPSEAVSFTAPETSSGIPSPELNPFVLKPKYIPNTRVIGNKNGHDILRTDGFKVTGYILKQSEAVNSSIPKKDYLESPTSDSPTDQELLEWANNAQRGLFSYDNRKNELYGTKKVAGVETFHISLDDKGRYIMLSHVHVKGHDAEKGILNGNGWTGPETKGFAKNILIPGVGIKHTLLDKGTPEYNEASAEYSEFSMRDHTEESKIINNILRECRGESLPELSLQQDIFTYEESSVAA